MSASNIFEFEFQIGGTITPEMRRAFENARRSMGGLEKNSGKTMKALKAGAAMAATAFAAVGAAVGKAVVEASKYQDAMAQVGAATGASAKEMQEIKEISKNLYNQNLGEDFNDLASAISTAKQVTQLHGKELQKATEEALLYRDVFGEDINESIKATDTMMKNFGITSSQAYNLLAQGAQQGLNKSDELLDSANEYAPYYKALGYSADEMFDSFKNGLQNGAFNLDKVGDAMKEFNIRAKDGSDAVSDAFTSLGFDTNKLTNIFAKGGPGAKAAFKDVATAISKVKDPAKQSQLAVALFGTQAEDLEMSVITSMANVKSEFDSTKDTMENVKKVKFDSLGSAFKAIGRQLYTGFVIPLGDALLPTLQTVSQYVGSAIPKISGYFKTVTSSVKTAVTSFAGLLTQNNGLSNYVNIYKTAFKGIVGVFSVLVPYVKLALGGIVNFAKNNLTMISKFWGENGKQIMQAVSNVFGVIKSVISFVMPFVAMIIKSVWGNIKGVITGALNIIMGAIKIFAGLFTGDFQKMWQGVKQLFKGAVVGIWNLLNLMFYGKILGGIRLLGKQALKGVSTMWIRIKQSFNSAILSIKNFFNLMFYGKILGGIRSLGKFALKGVSAMWSGIKGFFTSGTKSTVSKVVTFTNNVRNGFRAAKTKALDMVSGLWTGVKNYFSKMVDGAKALPGKLGQGIKNNASKALGGIKSMGNSMLSGIGKIVNGVINGLNWAGGKLGVSSKIPTWDVPKYARGTDGHKGGLAVLGDGGGSELYRTPNGQVGLSPARDTLMNLPQGTQVIPHRETQQILQSVPKYANGTGVSDAISKGKAWLNAGYAVGKKSFDAGVDRTKDVADEALDYLTSPTKLFSKILEKFNVSANIPNISGYFSKIGKGSFDFIKDGAMKWLEDKINVFSTSNPAANAAFSGVAGGSITNPYGVYDSIYQIAKMVMASPFGRGLVITSGHRPGDTYDHGRHNAIDLSGFGSNGGYRAVAQWASRLPGVSYTIGDNTVYGRKYGDGSMPGWATGHMNHVHISGTGGFAANKRFEKGGAVNTNDPILVGENGPEILQNRKNSRILNTKKTNSLLDNIRQFKNNLSSKKSDKKVNVIVKYNPVFPVQSTNMDVNALIDLLKSDSYKLKEVIQNVLKDIETDHDDVSFDTSF